MTTFEKTWQHGWNYIADTTSSTNSAKNGFWWMKAFISGQLPIRRLLKTNSGDNKNHAEVAGTTQDLLTQGLWTVLASTDGSTGVGMTTVAVASNNASLPQSTINVASTTNFATGSTTIAAGSNGASLPQSTINVASTTGFPSQGTLQVTTSGGVQTVAYTGTTGTTFTGCSGGTGSMSTGGAVTILGTIYISSSAGLQAINYTGTTGTTFTGCTGGTGTLNTGNGVYDCMDRSNGAGGIGTTTMQLGGSVGTTNSGASASFTTGATIAGAVRLTGVANMTANDVGNFIVIMGATTPGNNSPVSTVNPTPFKIVNYVSATSVDIYNPFASTTDTNNGNIAWQERNAYNLPGSTAGNYSTIVNATTGSNHTWWLMMSPTALGPYFMTFDYNVGTNSFGSFSVHKTISTVSNSPSSTTAPTFVDTTTFTGYQWVTTGQTGQAMHGSLSTDGYFNMFAGRANGVGYMEWVQSFQLVANAKSADQYPFVLLNRFQSGNTFGNTIYNTSGVFVTRNFNGTASMVLNPLYISANGTATGILTVNAGFNASQGDMPYADYSDSQFDDLPVYLFCQTSGSLTIKGRLTDVRGAPWLSEGFTEPNPSSPQSVFLGGFWWPCNLPPLL